MIFDIYAEYQRVKERMEKEEKATASVKFRGTLAFAWKSLLRSSIHPLSLPLSFCCYLANKKVRRIGSGIMSLSLGLSNIDRVKFLSVRMARKGSPFICALPFINRLKGVRELQIYKL